MTVYTFENRSPKIGRTSFVFPTADVIGDVEIGEGCFIGPGARLRADSGTIKIGNRTSVQDNCIMHTRPGEACIIGNDVIIGHGAVIHGARIEDNALIGSGAIVSDYAFVGEGSLVGEGAVVKSRMSIPRRKVAVGVPAKVISDVNDEQTEFWVRIRKSYEDFATFRYPRNLKKMEG
jgi:carbonic anhydrase/acetyltransferase-like protein (isoleucine patch superfamily)